MGNATILTLLICWFLFVFPALGAGAFILGAWVYFKGHSGQSPGISTPKFTIGRNGKPEQREREASRLPEV